MAAQNQDDDAYTRRRRLSHKRQRNLSARRRNLNAATQCTKGKDVQELPESIRRKKKLLVRDWFYYVLWYVRLRNVERKKQSAMSRLCKAHIANDPDRYKDRIREAADGMLSMKDWLSKEQHIKRLEQKERAELRGEFPSKDYNEVDITCRVETLSVQLYEKAI